MKYSFHASAICAFRNSKMLKFGFSILVCGTYYAVIFSTRELPGFLSEMKNLSKSDCDCLPDCHLMDFQYTVSTTDLM